MRPIEAHALPLAMGLVAALSLACTSKGGPASRTALEGLPDTEGHTATASAPACQPRLDGPLLMLGASQLAELALPAESGGWQAAIFPFGAHSVLVAPHLEEPGPFRAGILWEVSCDIPAATRLIDRPGADFGSAVLDRARTIRLLDYEHEGATYWRRTANGAGHWERIPAPPEFQPSRARRALASGLRATDRGVIDAEGNIVFRYRGPGRLVYGLPGMPECLPR